MNNDSFTTQSTTKDRKEKRPFIREACFTVFGDWVSTIEHLETEQDTNSAAYMLFKAIANYSLYNIAPDFKHFPQLSIFWPMLERQIDSSVDRRSKNFADEESDERRQEIIDIIERHPEYSCREIEKLTGIGKSTVNRIQRQYAAQKATTTSRDDGPSAGSFDAAGPVVGNSSAGISYTDGYPSHLYKSIPHVPSPGIDTMGRDSGTPDPFSDLDDDDGELPF